MANKLAAAYYMATHSEVRWDPEINCEHEACVTIHYCDQLQVLLRDGKLGLELIASTLIACANMSSFAVSQWTVIQWLFVFAPLHSRFGSINILGRLLCDVAVKMVILEFIISVL